MRIERANGRNLRGLLPPPRRRTVEDAGILNQHLKLIAAPGRDLRISLLQPTRGQRLAPATRMHRRRNSRGRRPWIAHGVAYPLLTQLTEAGTYHIYILLDQVVISIYL
jgi:hypothetical protein